MPDPIVLIPKRIKELTSKPNLDLTDLFVIDNDGGSFKITGDALITAARSSSSSTTRVLAKISYPFGKIVRQIEPVNDFTIVITFEQYPTKMTIKDKDTGSIIKTYLNVSGTITADIRDYIINKYDEMGNTIDPKLLTLLYTFEYSGAIKEEVDYISVVYPSYYYYTDNDGVKSAYTEVLLSPWHYKDVTLNCYYQNKGHKYTLLSPTIWQYTVTEARDYDCMMNYHDLFTNKTVENILVGGIEIPYDSYTTDNIMTANDFVLKIGLSIPGVIKEIPDTYIPYKQSNPGTGGGGTALYLNVLDYGAVGDGMADDTEAIRSAIEVLRLRGGGTLFFPKGIYRITEELNYHPIMPEYTTSNILKSVSFVGESIPVIRATLVQGEEYRVTEVYGSCIYFDIVKPEDPTTVFTNVTNLKARSWYKVHSGSITYNGQTHGVESTFDVRRYRPTFPGSDLTTTYNSLEANCTYEITEGRVQYNGTWYGATQKFSTGNLVASCTCERTSTLTTCTFYKVNCTGNFVVYEMNQGCHFSFTDCQNIEIRNLGFYSAYPFYHEHYVGGIYFHLHNNDNNPHHFIENVWLTCNGTGLVMAKPMMVIMNNVKSSLTLGSCFTMYGGTCTTMNCCYAITSAGNGFNFSDMTYFALQSCAAETCDIGYYFSNCKAGTLLGCGAEEIKQWTANCVAFYFCHGTTMTGIDCYNTKKYKSIWHIKECSNSVFNRTNFIKVNAVRTAGVPPAVPDYSVRETLVETLINNGNAIRCNLYPGMHHKSIVMNMPEERGEWAQVQSIFPIVKEWDGSGIPLGVVLFNNEWDKTTGLERTSQRYSDDYTWNEEVWVVREGRVQIRAAWPVNNEEFITYLEDGVAGSTSIIPTNYYEYMGRWIENKDWLSGYIYPEALVRFI